MTARTTTPIERQRHLQRDGVGEQAERQGGEAEAAEAEHDHALHAPVVVEVGQRQHQRLRRGLEHQPGRADGGEGEQRGPEPLGERRGRRATAPSAAAGDARWSATGACTIHVGARQRPARR